MNGAWTPLSYVPRLPWSLLCPRAPGSTWRAVVLWPCRSLTKPALGLFCWARGRGGSG